ncbi:hypothetical protein [Paenibacillus methanolicus]|uniref:Uncharacterized protein n=1 Tax=Paenibacillus methanolicus TaxID=582686 RepID=A0A5S5BSE0_9BACL|nr:hypothetical protein [Paenibacillus methanolicus]TYP70105.1 hypothetical protein BCM02_11283 [Paenibacillus methanolicus]
MKRFLLREEKGSAFLLVVFMLLLFTILGMAILSATIGGAARSQKAEDNVQTLHLADKALSEAVAYVMARFDNQSIKPAELTANLEKFVTDYNNSLEERRTAAEASTQSELKDNKNPQYLVSNICILGPTNTNKAAAYCSTGGQQDETLNKTLNTIRITATAEVNNVQRDLIQDVNLNTLPDFLNYAAGSEGNVIINGAPYFKGNLYAGKDFKVLNHAKYFLNNNELSEQSQFLYVDPVAENDDESGKVKVQSSNNVQYSTMVNGNYTSLYASETLPSQQLTKLRDSIRFTDTSKFISINIPETFVDKAHMTVSSMINRDTLWNAYINGGFTEKNRASSLIDMLKNFYDEKHKFSMPVRSAAAGEEDEAYDQAVQELSDKLTSLTSSAIFSGNLLIGDELKGIYFTDNNKTESNWLIIDGDLTIQNPENTPLQIRGNLLVTGRVVMNGKIQMDSTLISLGGTTSDPNQIVDAEIHGLEVNNKMQKLVMIANGPIDIYRVDSFQNLTDSNGNKGYDAQGGGASSSALEAFFYTDKEANLYGVGSLFWIRGGFFSKGDLTINAALGNTTKTDNAAQLTFTDQAQANETDARFVIDYDKSVFEGQLNSLPRVSKIRVELGQKKLQPRS